MVNIDFSISSARSLLKFGALRPVDARMVAQSELVTILGGVQDSFVKTQQTSVADAVDIVAKADDHINTWFGTWSDWARLQETSTGTYMEKSFAMQLHVGRFYIATLGLREIQNPEDVQAVQIPVIKTSCEAALQIMKVSSSYGEIRMRHATEFVLISSSVRPVSCSLARLGVAWLTRLPHHLSQSPPHSSSSKCASSSPKLYPTFPLPSPQFATHLVSSPALLVKTTTWPWPEQSTTLNRR